MPAWMPSYYAQSSGRIYGIVLVKIFINLKIHVRVTFPLPSRYIPVTFPLHSRYIAVTFLGYTCNIHDTFLAPSRFDPGWSLVLASFIRGSECSFGQN